MKLSITQENLAKALAVVSRAVSSRSSLPVLSNVLLSTDSNRLKLAATNLEIGINYWIGCKTTEDGSITVPARLFSDFITSLPGGNIELSSETTTLAIKTPHFESSINGIASDEFPLIPHIKAEPVLTVASGMFKDALTQVIVAASIDEARPVLSGIYMFVEKDELVMVATDSYRLAEKRLKLAGLKADAKLAIIVPVKTMAELTRILGDSEGDLQVYIGENQVMFEIDGVELTSRLIEGQFPNYQQIIPAKPETTITIDTSEFSRITKVAGLFAREHAGSMRLQIQAEGRVSIITSASQVGENTSNADCQVEGDDAEVSLNAKFLADALAIMKTPQITFSTSGKLNPCVLKPIGKNVSPDYLHIIMPLRT
jgi:DNA polymerase-3 subunit beta